MPHNLFSGKSRVSSVQLRHEILNASSRDVRSSRVLWHTTSQHLLHGRDAELIKNGGYSARHFIPRSVTPSRSKAQTTLVLILFVLIIFGGIAVFLLSFAKTISQKEYENIFVHDMLVSVLRSDASDSTNPDLWKDSNCRLVSDLIKCSFSGGFCGGEACTNIAKAKTEGLTNSIIQIYRPGWTYAIVAEPQTFSAAGQTFEAGNDTLLKWWYCFEGKPAPAGSIASAETCPRVNAKIDTVLTALEVIPLGSDLIQVSVIINPKPQ